MADQDGVDPDDIDDLERQIYRAQASRRDRLPALDFEGHLPPRRDQGRDGADRCGGWARDEEFFGDVLDPAPDEP